MRVLFLVPYPIGEAPSQRFRFEQYFHILEKGNIQFSVSSFWSMSAWNVLYQPGNWIAKFSWLVVGSIRRWIDLFRSLKYDWIFIHRECAPVGPPVFEFILSKILRRKIIYDFDDAIWLDNTSPENKIASWFKFHKKVKSICRWGYRISCGNEWLADFARMYNTNVIVNPTTIDCENYHIPQSEPDRSSGKIIIGWTGTHSTIFYLKALIPVLQQIEKKFPVTIKIISNKNPDLPFEAVEFVQWKKETEISDLLSFDVGLMPLDDDDWAKGKCGFKALQYMALEIPCLASPVGVNNKIITHGENGLLCFTPAEWKSTIEQLIEDRNLRKKIGESGRKKVVENYSVNSNSSNFLSLLRL